MELVDGLMIKQLEDHKSHFRQRLVERYSVHLLPEQYDELCKENNFQGVMSKTSTKTIGWVTIHRRDVCVLYDSKLKCFSTCYPPDVETDLFSAFRACFGMGMRRVAFAILYSYLQEKKTIPSFESDKDAGLYLFSKTMFPTLHMAEHKYKTVPALSVMMQINRVINGDNPHVKITVQRVEPT